jgi:hypothetical protein
MRFGHVIMSIFCAWVLWGTPFDKATVLAPVRLSQ